CHVGYFGFACEIPCRYPNFGDNCQLGCRCNEEFCDHVNGCQECPPGFRGKTCQQNCSYPYFGVNCKSKCNCRKEECNYVTGCEKCPPGFQGKACQQNCSYPYYGEKCQSKCDCRKEECNYVTGCEKTGEHKGKENNFLIDVFSQGVHRVPEECIYFISGCDVGYFGLRCELQCRYPNYGSECQSECKCNKLYCDHVSGCFGKTYLFHTDCMICVKTLIICGQKYG
ncbi:multiple epidermal growth factor-like domains protein 11, partial [Saccostrea cucullata]|uniref:multiple epidermal growth factor-like domains protein 11 n=1 Tax=Saccostrea cuccullata TaxID=36930 RepID=UPI002ED1EA55